MIPTQSVHQKECLFSACFATISLLQYNLFHLLPSVLQTNKKSIKKCSLHALLLWLICCIPFIKCLLLLLLVLQHNKKSIKKWAIHALLPLLLQFHYFPSIYQLLSHHYYFYKIPNNHYKNLLFLPFVPCTGMWVVRLHLLTSIHLYYFYKLPNNHLKKL